MITKERLVALINQEATIWWDGHFEIKLNPIQYSVEKAYDGKIVLWYQPKDEPSGYDWDWELEDLREDVDRAKWEYKMNTKRTERFEPPMWEEIEECFDCIDYKFAFVKNNEVYAFTVDKNGAIDISKWFVYKLGFQSIYSSIPTKENYEKACEIVRDLFKGRKK